MSHFMNDCWVHDRSHSGILCAQVVRPVEVLDEGGPVLANLLAHVAWRPGEARVGRAVNDLEVLPGDVPAAEHLAALEAHEAAPRQPLDVARPLPPLHAELAALAL